MEISRLAERTGVREAIRAHHRSWRAAYNVGRGFDEARGFDEFDTGSVDIDGEIYETVIYRRSL